MSSDTIYGAMGAVAMTVGFSMLAISTGNKDTSLVLASIGLIVIGMFMATVAYINAKRNERNERKIKFIEYNNAVNMIKELKKANENISSLISEIRQERNERTDKDKQ